MWIFKYIIIIIISFMQGICTYIPETNYVPREYSVADILLLLFMVLISLVSALNLFYFYISTFRSMCAVLNMAVFCSSLTFIIIIIIIIIITVVETKNCSSKVSRQCSVAFLVKVSRRQVKAFGSEQSRVSGSELLDYTTQDKS
jgi:hypothetical protein